MNVGHMKNYAFLPMKERESEINRGIFHFAKQEYSGCVIAT